MAELWAKNIIEENLDNNGEKWTFDRCPERLKPRVAEILKEQDKADYITDKNWR